MTPDQKNRLIDHLDENLRGKATATLEDIIGNDPEAENEWNYLHLAVETVKDAGLNQQVAAARAAWKAEFEAAANKAAAPVLSIVPATENIEQNTPEITSTEKSSDTAKSSNVSRIYRYTLRAAACVLIVAGSSAIYKYVSVSSGSLYDQYYTNYSLNTARGAGDTDPIVTAYNTKDWTTVQKLAASANPRTNQTDFLAGMACLEQKQYDDAISHFEQIIAVNTHAGTDYYKDESEYYLAISWLARNNVSEAMPILEKIKADQHHQYHEKVTKMSFFDLRLAQYKENK